MAETQPNSFFVDYFSLDMDSPFGYSLIDVQTLQGDKITAVNIDSSRVLFCFDLDITHVLIILIFFSK